jgi:hypothetical protein
VAGTRYGILRPREGGINGGGATSFNRSIKAVPALRSSIPAVEAYYYDHKAYTGMTLGKIRAIDRGISGNIRVRLAAKERYCVEINAGVATWSYSGPGGEIILARCPTR